MTKDYLRDGFQSDREAVRALQRQVEDLLKVFHKFWPKATDKGWPYSLANGRRVEREEHYSFSTNAMISFAVAAGSAFLDDSVLMPLRRSVGDKDFATDYAPLTVESVQRFKAAMEKIQTFWGEGIPPDGQLEHPAGPSYGKVDHLEGKDVRTFSGTFGLNDPFTLTWMIEILRAFHTHLNPKRDETVPERDASLTPVPMFSMLSGEVDELLRELRTAADEMLRRATSALESQPSAETGPRLLLLLEEDLRHQHQLDEVPPGESEATADEPAEEASNQVESAVLKRKASRTRALMHSFPLLGYIHLAKAISRIDGAASGKEDAEKFLSDAAVRQALLDTVHLQLSNHEIPGSAFDVGELVFALEGLLLLDQREDSTIRGIDPALAQRAIEVVAENHQINPSWRPLRPFIVTKQGFVLLPVSVEVANSLLRVWYMLEPKLPTRSHYFTQYVEMFGRYEEWLRSRQVWGKVPDMPDDLGEFTGWHSEHRMVVGSIDLWETSQVLLFYVLYAEVLQRHMASQAVLAARLRISRPERKETDRSVPNDIYWTNECIIEKETLESLGSKSRLRVFTRILEDFIDPWTDKDPRRRRPISMLLYGPPGTGKTTIAKDIATTLQWPFIELSPSDFIAGGPSLVEARARDIFDALREQTRVVIFFDEIDRLVLDRDSRWYEGQEDIFQFMTPSMLTKFQDLHDVGRSIFIIGTNYGERIDRAIKRAGRIDRLYLVPPPDLASRRRILVEKGLRKDLAAIGQAETLSPADEAVLGEVARMTPLAIYGELVGLVSRAFSDPNNRTPSAIVAAVQDEADRFSPAFSVEGFRDRFGINPPNNDGKTKAPNDAPQKPYDELVLALYLFEEARDLDSAAEVMTELKDYTKGFKDDWPRAIERFAPDLPSDATEPKRILETMRARWDEDPTPGDTTGSGK